MVVEVFEIRHFILICTMSSTAFVLTYMVAEVIDIPRHRREYALRLSRDPSTIRTHPLLRTGFFSEQQGVSKNEHKTILEWEGPRHSGVPLAGGLPFKKGSPTHAEVPDDLISPSFRHTNTATARTPRDLRSSRWNHSIAKIICHRFKISANMTFCTLAIFECVITKYCKTYR